MPKSNYIDEASDPKINDDYSLILFADAIIEDSICFIPFDGYVGHLRFWNRTLTADDALNLLDPDK